MSSRRHSEISSSSVRNLLRFAPDGDGRFMIFTPAFSKYSPNRFINALYAVLEVIYIVFISVSEISDNTSLNSAFFMVLSIEPVISHAENTSKRAICRFKSSAAFSCGVSKVKSTAKNLDIIFQNLLAGLP